MAGEWPNSTVLALQRDGVLLVEDGNHGESRPRPDEFVDVGVAFIRATDLDAGRVLFETAGRINQRARKRITKGIGSPGDVLLSHKGTVGKVALVADDAPPFVCSPQTTFWRTLDQARLDRRYLYAFLRSAGFHAQLATRAGETDMAPYVSLTSQRGLSVTVPPIAAQRAIACILGTLDDKIELNRRANETLEAIARALFKSWFVDFDPVRAKAEGCDPGLPPAIGDLFPDSFEDSELGATPTGWGTMRLGDRLTLDKGLSYKGQFLTEDGIPMINLGCFGGKGRFLPAAVKCYSGEYKQRHIVRSGDLLLANTDITQKREVIGSPALIPATLSGGDMIFSHHVFAVRFEQAKEPWRVFVYFLLLQESFRERAAGYATGTTVLALPRDAILDLSCAAAPATLVKAFEGIAVPLLQRQWANNAESSTLAALRDALLPKLISGELRVKDAERVAEAAV